MPTSSELPWKWDNYKPVAKEARKTSSLVEYIAMTVLEISKTKARFLIQQGKVTVNGVTVYDPDQQIDVYRDVIEVLIG
jgi:RNA-binding protein YlmH